MPLLRPRTASLIGLLAAGLACSNAPLEPIPPPDTERADNKLAVEGSFCTTDPDDVAFPVKILFVMDTSASMGATDPEGRRVDAILEVVDEVFDIDGVEIGLIVFGQGANVLTERCDDYATRTNCVPGFAPPEEAINVIAGAGTAGGTTDYVNTMNLVLSTLATDLALGDPAQLENSRYVIIFASDGLPDTDSRFNPEQVCIDAARWESLDEAPENAGVITDIGELLEQTFDLADQYNVREISFNTAFAAAEETASEIKACGSSLMRAMSRQGGGVFRDFSSGEDINFLFVDFTSFKRVFAMKNFMATNLNARPFSNALGIDVKVRDDDPTLAAGIIDSDGDGLADDLERLIGTDRFLQDTDADGFSDLLEFNLRLSGFDPLDPSDADCVAELDQIDTDGDGLRDCEERFFGTLTRTYDTDNDGFGDGMEILFGANPNLADTLLDVDFDGMRNGNEMRAHSRLDFDDVDFLTDHAYRTKVRETGLEGSTLCYDFSVENIALASTRGATAQTVGDGDTGVAAIGLGGGAMAPGENRIIIEVTEAAFDAPDQAGVARLGCVRAFFDAENRVKNPANGRITMPRQAFLPATEFDPALHCVSP